MRRDAVLRLTRLHLHRTVKPMWKLGLATIGVVMIPVFLGGGLNPDMTVAFGAVFLMYLPCNLALNMTQEKIDGSLRFLSSLPVTGREHAASRVLATAALTIPLPIWLAVLLPLFQLESLPGGPVVTGLGMGAAVFLVSLVVIAFQYKYSGPKARSVFVYVLAAFVAIFWISTMFEESPAVLLTPAVIAAGALICGIGMAAVGWFAVRTIVEYAPAYDRERHELTSGVGG